MAGPAQPHFGKLGKAHQAQAPDDGAGTGCQGTSDVPDAPANGFTRVLAGGQFLAVTADQEQAVVRPGSIQQSDGEDLADIDQVDAGDEGQQGEALESDPNGQGDGPQRHQGQ